jgi:hypothetical protein
MSESPSLLLCDGCQKGFHHELQLVENCACPVLTQLEMSIKLYENDQNEN